MIRRLRQLPEHQLAKVRLLWLCATLAYLAISEWRVWTQAETIPLTPANIGTGLLAGLSSLLLVQLFAMAIFGFVCRGWRLPTACRPGGAELWLGIAVTALGIVVRFAALQDVPIGLWFDTAEDGNQALRILHDPNYRPVFIAEATQLPGLFVYFDALSVNLFGSEALAVRVPAALFGAATVPAMWWLGRQLGGPALGIAAAFALATSRWHLDFTRLALASIVTPFALTLALAATVAALRAGEQQRRIVFSILAGGAVSLGMWSYPAAILIVPALVGGVAWWIVRGWTRQWSVRLPRAGVVLFVAAVTGIVTLGPLIGLAIKDPDTVLQRSQTVAVSGANATHEVIESATQHVLMFTARGDRNGRHNTPGRPELGWFAPFFLAGVGAAMWRLGSPLSLAVPAALLFLITGILTLPFEAPQSHRVILATVPASLLIGLALALVWSRYRALAVLLSGLFVVAGGVEVADYFRAQLEDSAVYQENSLLETEAGRWLHTLEPNVPVLAVERFRTHPTVRYLSGDHPSVAAAGTAVSEFLPLDGSRSAAVLASFDEASLFERARGLYTQTLIQTFGAPIGQGQPLLFTMFVSRQVQEQTRGFLAERADGSVVPVADLGSSDARSWSATMRVLGGGDYSVDAGGNTFLIDDETVASAAQPVANVFLARGAHGIRLVRPDTAESPRLRVSPAASPAATSGQPPPSDVLFFALPPPGGLLFTWQIQGRPVQALIDSAPHRGFEGTFNNGLPWTAQWRGQLRAAAPGDYSFRLEAITTATLSIDSRQVLSSGTENRTTLTTGWHDIRIDYVDRDPYARLFVNWRPPGQADFTAIPDEVLLPALRLP